MKFNKMLGILGVSLVIAVGVFLFSKAIWLDGMIREFKGESQEVNKIETVAATNADVEVLYLVGTLHNKLNSALGYGRVNEFKSSTYIKEYYDGNLKSLIERLEKENSKMTSFNLYKDLTNVITLGKIINENKADKMTMRYLHRIVHDLDSYVLRDQTVKEYWETIHSGQSSHVKSIEKHICEKLNMMVKDYQKQTETSFAKISEEI